MKIGIGSYALFWEWNERAPEPLDIPQMLDRAAQLGCEVFQICDDPRVPYLSAAELTAIKTQASSLGLDLELGTRGTNPAHLREFVAKARLLGARTLRSMVQRVEVDERGLDGVTGDLSALIPDLDGADITLALETYEQVSTGELVGIVSSVDSPRVGICLDPANCVSALENPADVIESTAPFVTNLHVKDFAFTRNEGWVGFLYAGARMGAGLLDLDAELSAVYTDGRDPSAIVEHWVPWHDTIEQTIAIERDWTNASLTALRKWRDDHTYKEK